MLIKYKMGCCFAKDEQPLLNIEEPYYILDSPDVLIVSNNTPANRNTVFF